MTPKQGVQGRIRSAQNGPRHSASRITNREEFELTAPTAIPELAQNHLLDSPSTGRERLTPCAPILPWDVSGTHQCWRADPGRRQSAHRVHDDWRWSEQQLGRQSNGGLMNKKIITTAALAGVLVGLGAAPAFADSGSIQVDLSQPGHPCYLVASAPFGQTIDWTKFSTTFPLSSGNALDILVTPVNNGQGVAVCQGADAHSAPSYSIPFAISYKGEATNYTLVHVDPIATGESMTEYLKAAGAKPAEYAALGLTEPNPAASTSAPSPSVAPLTNTDQTVDSRSAALKSSPSGWAAFAIAVLLVMIAAVWITIRRQVRKRGADRHVDLP